MQTVQGVPQLDTCTSPHFCTSYRHFNMNASLTLTWCCLGWKYAFYFLIIFFWRVMICTPDVTCERSTDWSESRYWDPTRTQTWCCTVQSTSKWVFMEICFLLLHFCHIDYHYCYNCTTTYIISITSPHYHFYWSIMSFKATSARKGMVFLWILNNSGSVVMTC